MTAWHAVTVRMDDKLVTLNAAVGLLRRRNMPIRNVTVGPDRTDGTTRLFAMIETDAGTAQRVAELFRKIIGVQDARVAPADEAVLREAVLVRLRPGGADAYAGLLEVLGVCHACGVEESADDVVAEVSGPASFVLSCVRALERFGLVDVARSGTLAVDRPIPGPAVIQPTEMHVP